MKAIYRALNLKKKKSAATMNASKNLWRTPSSLTSTLQMAQKFL